MEEKGQRRKASRHPLRWKAAIVFDGGQGLPPLHTQTLDLSESGAAIFSDRGDLTGSTINLLLAPPMRGQAESPRIFRARAQVVSTRRTPDMAQYRHGLRFLRTPGDGLDALVALIGSAVAAPEPAPVSRIEQLRRMAQSREGAGPLPDPQEALRTKVSDAIGRAYRYLRDLTEQLNKVHPAFSRGYGVAGVPEFRGLVWETGYADFHMREISPTTRLNERATLRFRLSADRRIRVDREYPAAEKLQRLLEDSGIEFHAHGVWNKRGSLERTTFDFPCEVSGHLLLQGQFDVGRLLLRTRNVSGFGSMEQLLAPDALTEDALDELAAFILGETPVLGPLLLRGS